MVASLDSGLEFYRQVLALRGYRQEVLSSDIANASTPGFKAVDVDFAEALKNATGGSSVSGVPGSGAPGAAGRVWLVDDARQMQPTGGAASGVLAAAASSVKYQVGGNVTLDGNSVDLDHEKTAAAENAVDYEAAATFTTQTIKMLMTAINGSAASQAGGA